MNTVNDIKVPKVLKVLVVGCGHMGASHAAFYEKTDGFHVAGLVSRSAESRESLARALGRDIPLFDRFEQALEQVKPDAVSINTYPDTHAEYALAALNAGCHVFLEKPLAENLADAEKVLEAARRNARKLVVGYILRHHPTMVRFLEIGKTLGKPLVMRMNLNQQSVGAEWETHKHLMESCSPIVDCGVHYVDLMCQATGARPVRVHAVGARLSDEIDTGMYNYGQLQVSFDDGSVGWYEAGWGPMMSEEAHFIKDLIGPRGSVSIVQAAKPEGASSDVDGHTRASTLRVHHAERDAQGAWRGRDERIRLPEDPSHQDLCDREQAFFLKAIREDLDLTEHHDSVLNSMRIVLAADASFRTGSVVEL